MVVWVGRGVDQLRLLEGGALCLALLGAGPRDPWSRSQLFLTHLLSFWGKEATSTVVTPPLPHMLSQGAAGRARPETLAGRVIPGAK